MMRGHKWGSFVVLALFLSLISSCATMEAQRLNQKVIELYGQGRYSEAINYEKKVLEIVEKAMGKEHPDVATSLNNLAALYKSTGRYSEAEPLFKRSLEIWEKTLAGDEGDGSR
ncbi:MAG: tetratricopeptide repeat protein [Nitrospirae bacterium]|nr:tetratricopeptide repeat protein [Nitrospirota bacterium]